MTHYKDKLIKQLFHLQCRSRPNILVRYAPNDAVTPDFYRCSLSLHCNNCHILAIMLLILSKAYFQQHQAQKLQRIIKPNFKDQIDSFNQQMILYHKVVILLTNFFTTSLIDFQRSLSIISINELYYIISQQLS